MNRLTLLLTFTFLAFLSSTAQELRPRWKFLLNVDYARFRNDSTSSYVEIYYSFYSGAVTYRKSDSTFRGTVLLTTLIESKDFKDTLVYQRHRLPLTLQDTSLASMRMAYVLQSGFALKHGEYLLKVFAFDSLQHSRRDSVALSVSLVPYPKKTAVSDIEVCSEIKNSTAPPGLFTKNSLEVVPNPGLVFGAASYPVLFRYMELYNVDTSLTYFLTTQLIDPLNGLAVKKDQKLRKYAVRNTVDVGLTNVTSVKSGKYLLRMTLSDTSQTEIFRTEKVFYLNNPHIKAVQMAASSMKAAELAGLTSDELAEEFRKAKYIATDNEIKTFNAISSLEGRREFLAKFWVDVETGRPPVEGLVRVDYLRRVETATQRFRSFKKDGWLTDRGRVFVMYGEPDEIERFPSNQGQKPYEIWHYYQIENGVQFIFIDRSGFGEYNLVSSTKRGEIQDDNWQSYLQ